MTGSRGHSLVVVVDEGTKVGDARRRAAALLEPLGFEAVKQGQAALVVTEAATNLVKHAPGGQLLLTAGDFGGAGTALDIMTLDSGPGMADVSRCMADGFSSSGTRGTGLGAIARTADSFDIYSLPGAGTALWARLRAAARPPAGPGCELDLGVVSVPLAGETVCGDNWATVARDGLNFVLVADGLGHGHAAAEAADEAVRVFQGHRSREPSDILESTHQALRATRGAALAIARIDPVRGELRYAGVGNIAGVIHQTATGKSVSLVSQNGTAGYAIRKIQSFDYPWSPGSLLLMHSDGLATHWRLDRYPGLDQRRPALVAGMLYRDHKRTRDDVTILVARCEGDHRS
jgi:anti-sigma regulatory factor (Ser/Thr protein kinase)